MLSTLLPEECGHECGSEDGAGVVGERAAEDHRLRSVRIREIATVEWPLVESGLLPAALLGLAWAGAYSRHTGIVLALAAAIVQLVGWGAFAAHRSEPNWWKALLLGAFDGLLGLAIVALEVAVH